MSERSMRQLLKLVAQRVGLSYTDVVDWLRDTNSLAAIEERIIAGQYASAIAGVDDAAKMLAADIHDGYVTSGKRAAQWLDARIPDKLVRFDLNDLRVVQRAKANELELVQGFQDERWQVSRQITQRAMVEGAGAGINPRRVAQDFRDSIGLTPSQEAHVASYRRALEQGDYASVMRRELHDDRANRLLRGVRARGESLTAAQIDKYTEQYRKAYVSHRATTIARTEALRNAHDGHADAIDQAVERGDVDVHQLGRTWHAGPRTPKARDTHQAMDEVVVRIGEDFVLPDGTRMARPGDPNGGAENTANCRCASSVSYVDIPEGFTANAQIVEGLPAFGDVDPDVVYSLTPAEYRSRLIALPGGGADERRLQSISDAWNAGTKLEPVRLAMTEGGDLYVEDGRHRLLAAQAQGRSVLARIDRAVAGVDRGTVRLGKAA